MARNAPPASNNALTPSFASVSSAAGFSSGDLVYSKDSNFGLVANNAVSSATFPVTGSVSSAFMNQNGVIKQATPSGGGVFGHGKAAAKLTNGNIVIVGGSPNEAAVFFRIIDENNTEIVARTFVDPTTYQAVYGAMDVVALTGGGFALIWRSSGNTLHRAIYSNTGAVVSAVASTGFNCSGYLTSSAMPNGNFIIAWNNKSNTALSYFMIISPTGTVVLTRTSTTINPVGNNVPVIPAVRSDNTFFIVQATTATNITARRYDAAGTFVATYTVATNWSNTSYSYSACIISNNATASRNNYLVVAYNDSTPTLHFGWVDELNVATSNFNMGYTTGTESIVCTSTGDLIVVAGFSTAGYAIVYKFDGNGFAYITERLIPGLAIGGFPSQTYNTVVETTNYFSVFTSSMGEVPASTGYAPLCMVYAQVNLALTQVRSTNTFSTSVGNVSANVSGYARSNSTPNSAAFLASTTQSLTVSQVASNGPTSWLVNPTIIENANCLSMTMMQNGQYVVAFSKPTTGEVKFSVYDSAGVLLSTSTVASTSANTGTGDGVVRCCTLANGKLLIAYPTSSSNVTFALYTTSYALEINAAYVGWTISGTNQLRFGFSVSPVGFPANNGRFAFAANQSGVNQCVGGLVESSTMAGIANSGFQYGASTAGHQVYGLPNGSFIFTTVQESNGVIVGTMTLDYTGTVWTNTQTYQLALATGAPTSYGQYGSVSPNGVVTFMENDSAGTTLYICRVQGNTNANNLRALETVGASANAGNVGILANGIPISFVYYSNNARRVNWWVPALRYQPGNDLQTLGGLGDPTLVPPSVNSLTPNGANLRIIGLYDNVAAFAYLDTSQVIRVGQLAIGSASYSSGIIAGTTASNPAFYPSPSNGYYLAGVAASNCTAGGTGVVQTNGAATLNSQYPATTTSQAFDFTSLTLSGVRGTIAGRNLVIRGS
jgi:hypothetical protein